MRTLHKISLFSLIALGSPVYAVEPPAIRITDACTGSERWIGFNQGFTKETIRVVESLTKYTPERVFAEGLALRKRAQSDLEIAAGEYMMSRGLHGRGLLTVSDRAFRLFLEDRDRGAAALPFERAALQCLGLIAAKDPSFRISEGLAIEPAWLAPGGGVSEETAMILVLNGTQSAMRAIEPSSPRAKFLKAVQAAEKRDQAGVIKELAPIAAEPAWPTSLRARKSEALLLLARAYYSRHEFEKAAEAYRMVPKSSNQLAQSLVELSWAYLMAGRYPDAVGTALHLRLGGLSRTFAPESEMVIAMAENEICQYPDSTRAISFFRKRYLTSYEWLEKNTGRMSTSPYQEALTFLRKKSEVPPRVAGEWIRSPLFLASQEGILRIGKEDRVWDEMPKEARSEEAKWQASVIQELRKFRKEYELNERKTSPKLLARFQALKRDLQGFRRFGDAAPVVKALLEKSRPMLGVRKGVLISRVDRRIESENHRMLTQLREVAENNERVEIEIYSGASQDLLWKEAHPDYQDTLGDARMDGAVKPGQRFWDWGRVPSAELESSEIWEDELGSSQADLTDNCSNKEKYMELKQRKRAGL